ncbi:hypothetical protein YQE_09922, partial [Dendroctonus ponderosae]
MLPHLYLHTRIWMLIMPKTFFAKVNVEFSSTPFSDILLLQKTLSRNFEPILQINH